MTQQTDSAAKPSLFRLSFRKASLWALAIALGAVFLMAVRPYHSYDVWHHIRSGWYAAPWNHGPAVTEPFSSPGRQLGLEWTQYEWLAQVLIYLSHVHFGVSATIILKAGVYAIAFWFLAQAARTRGANRFAVAVALLATALAVWPRMQVRPGAFSFLAFGVLIWLLEGFRHGLRHRIWVAPVLFAAWANMHGAYVAGWVLLGINAFAAGLSAWLAKRDRSVPIPAWRRGSAAFNSARPSEASDSKDAYRLAVVLLACVAAVCLNPYGLRILAVPFELTRSETVRSAINEWKPATLGIWLSVESLFVPLFVGALFAGRRRITVADVAVFAAFGFLALTARRHISLAAFVAAPIAADALTPTFQRLLGKRPRIALGAIGLLAIVSLARPLGLGRDPLSPTGVSLRRFDLGIERDKYPVLTADYLANHGPGGNLFNEYGDGNYMVWRLNNATDDDFPAFAEAPPWLVFIDGRIDVYGAEVASMYEAVADAKEGWRDILARFGVKTCVAPYARTADRDANGLNWGLTDALWIDAQWALVFWDDHRMTFVHASALGDRHAFRVRPDTFEPHRAGSRGELDAAIADLRRRVGMGPAYDCARARALLAQALQAAGDAKGAVPHLRQAHNLRPEDPQHVYNLGAALLQAEQPEEAAEWFRLAIRLGGQEPAKPWNALAYCYILMGDNESALRSARRSVREDPTYATGFLTLSLALEKTGRVEEALAAVKRAAALSPGNPSVAARMNHLQDIADP